MINIIPSRPRYGIKLRWQWEMRYHSMRMYIFKKNQRIHSQLEKREKNRKASKCNYSAFDLVGFSLWFILTLSHHIDIFISSLRCGTEWTSAAVFEVRIFYAIFMNASHQLLVTKRLIIRGIFAYLGWGWKFNFLNCDMQSL